ncbi:MAG TPA: hypothetical protein PK850_07435 [Ignavibacteria bacterium]|nr:hypothetical protein [Ignavibacteria bacterium]
MLITIAAKWIVVLFGVYIVFCGVIMLVKPAKARELLRKAGSTNLINNGEITFRMILSLGLILAAELSRFPNIFSVTGWFMLFSSFILYLIPRKLHQSFSLKFAEFLTPNRFRILSPITFLLGSFILYGILK